MGSAIFYISYCINGTLHRHYLSVCPLVRNGIGGEGTTHSPEGEGWVGGLNSDDWRKSLALCLLCGMLKGTVSRDWIGPCMMLMDRP
jgi:hypothetical protein